MEKICETCDIKFYDSKKKRRFCSRKCVAPYMSELYSDGRLCGDKNPNFGKIGKKRTKAQKRSLSLARMGNTNAKGTKRNSEQLETLSKSQIGRRHSKKTKIKMSISAKEAAKRPETKARRSAASQKRWLDGNYDNAKHGRGKGGYHNGIWMRSSWELAFAKFLDELKIEWRYEPIRFKLKFGKTYRPDFYLIKKNLYIEIKGHWYEIALEKFKQFKKEYPRIKILVIEEQIWKKPAKDFVRLLSTKAGSKKSTKKTLGMNSTQRSEKNKSVNVCSPLPKQKRNLPINTTLH